MDLGNVGGLAVIVGDRLAAHCHIAGKGMTELVCQHLHIKYRVIEAGEHKGRLEAGQARHIAGGRLARLVLQIHQLMVYHEVDELAGLGADLVVHLLRCFDHKCVVARGLGVAVGEHHLFVIPHHMVDAEALCLRVIELFAQRHQEFAHLLAEGCDLFFAVVGASLLKVADGDIVLIAEVFTHLVADADKLAPDLLQTRLVRFIEFRVCLDGSSTDRTVGMLEILLHAVEVQGLAVEVDLGGSHDLLILIGQACLLLAQRNVRLAEQLFLQIHGDKKLLAELALDVGTVRAFGDSLAECDLCAAERGHRVLKIIDLRLVKFVAGVQCVTDVRDRILREQLAVHAVHLKKQTAQRGITLCVLDGILPCGKLRTARLKIGTLVLER